MAPETYAIVLKETGLPVGSIGFHHNDLAPGEDEAELGYWIGVPYWGQGLVPEAGREMLRHAFEDLKLKRVWCGYYEGNEKSRRVQEKLGFKPQWVNENTPVPQLQETRVGHVNLLRREGWEDQQGHPAKAFITLRECPDFKEKAAEWFHEKWGVPKEAYLECMDAYLSGETEYGWYLCLDHDRIVGGMGVIENDFHDRKDLKPNVCAVYTEEAYRGQGIAGKLLNMTVGDLRSKGIFPVYLVTDHTGFYERYGWEFFCMVQGDGEPEMTRMYIHR